MSRHQTLTFDQHAALPNILSLIHLSSAKLTQSECASLCHCFHSVPYAHRTDGLMLSRYFELAQLAVRAASRAETMKIISGSPALQEIVRDLLASVQSLLLSAQLGAKQ